MPFKSEAQRKWMHANEPEMADEWEEHTPKNKKLPKKVAKSESIDQKLAAALSGSGHGILLESRRHQPALILMNRGTLIPVHHAREVRSPESGELWVIAGMNPGKYERIHSGHYPNGWYMALRDFFALREYIPHQAYVRKGLQDETGWFEPDANGRYDARRDLRVVRKFQKILTMKRDNVRTLEMLEPGTDPTQYEYKNYDDASSYWRKRRTRGNRID